MAAVAVDMAVTAEVGSDPSMVIKLTFGYCKLEISHISRNVINSSSLLGFIPTLGAAQKSLFRKAPAVESHSNCVQVDAKLTAVLGANMTLVLYLCPGADESSICSAEPMMVVPQLVRIKKMLLRLASAMELPPNPLDQVRKSSCSRSNMLNEGMFTCMGTCALAAEHALDIECLVMYTFTCLRDSLNVVKSC